MYSIMCPLRGNIEVFSSPVMAKKYSIYVKNANLAILENIFVQYLPPTLASTLLPIKFSFRILIPSK